MKSRYIILGATTAMMLAVASVSAGSVSAGVAVPEDSAKVESAAPVIPETSIVDEVIWVVGDEPILKSDVESMRLQAETEGIALKGNPDCTLPEQLAVQKLFLHQAAIDSIEVTESEIQQGLDDQIDRWVQLVGSQEKLEEYQRKSMAQIRRDMHDDFKNNLLVSEMKKKLVTDVVVTPSEVRNYFSNLPADSLPFVPTEVEVEIITQQPRFSIEEVNRVKDRLREFTDRVNKGETTFATLARLYSEDTNSARRGGELGFTGRAVLDPAFANVAFNLTDPKKISKIVESEFGYHIIQLIDKRGDRINVRHILLKPQVSTENVEKAVARLDSIAEVGQVSQAFTMINSRGKLTTAIVKLKNRVEAHRATITEDYQVMKNVVLGKRREAAITDWVTDKIKHTYVRMNDRYKDCEFEYQGWIK